MSKSNKRLVPLLVILAILAVAGGAFYLYDSAEKAEIEAMREASKKPVAKEPEVIERAKPSATRTFAPLDEPPLTLAALQLLPDTADLAIGIPPVTTFLDKIVPLLENLAGPGIDVSAEIKSIAQGIALEMGMPEEEEDLAKVLTTLGFDVNTGGAAFFTSANTMDGVLKLMAENKRIRILETPGFTLTLALPVVDAALAEENLLKFLGNLLVGIEVTEEEVAGLTLKQYEDHAAYFVTPTHFVISTDMDMLKSAAEHVNAPAVFQYGTADYPPEQLDEGVSLSFLNRMEPFMDYLEAEIEKLDPLAGAMASVEMDTLKALFEDSVSEEPLVSTWTLSDEALVLKAKVSSLAYPILALNQGEGMVMKWAQRLPENTLAFLSLNLNDALKRVLTKDYLAAVPEEVLKSSKVSKAMPYVPNVMQLLGGEITIGLTGLDPLDMPSLFVVINLINPGAATMFLQMAPQQASGELHKDIQIQQLTLPTPIPVYFAVVDSALILTNSDEGLRSLIDLSVEEASSGFYTSLTPPMNGDALIYQSFYLDPSLYTDVVDPITSLMGMNLPEKYTDIAEMVANLVENVRLTVEQDGEWSTSTITVARKSGVQAAVADEAAEDGVEEAAEEAAAEE